VALTITMNRIFSPYVGSVELFFHQLVVRGCRKSTTKMH